MAKKINIDNRTLTNGKQSHIDQDNFTNLHSWVAAILNEKGITTGGVVVPEWTETTVTITAVELAAIGTTFKELLPAAGVDTYYEYEMAIEKASGNSIATGTVDYFSVGGDSGNARSLINPGEFGLTASKVALVSSYNGVWEVDALQASSYAHRTNNAVVFTTYNANDPGAIVGDLLVKIKYRIKSIG